MTKKRISAGFVARSAGGSQRPQASGRAMIAGIQNISTMVAGRSGILSTRAGYVRAVDTNGAGLPAYAARDGRYMKTGI